MVFHPFANILKKSNCFRFFIL